MMAYVYMPLFFTILGYGIVYFAALPLIDTIQSYSSLFLSSSTPDFAEDELKSIFEAPVNVEEDKLTVSAAKVELPSIGNLYATITSEKIGLSGNIYFGDNDAILKKGVGQYPGTTLPGFGKPIMLAAHNTTYFLPLQNAEVGDIITITTSYGVYKYQITECKIADKKDKSAYDFNQDKEQLIMYTCYPFNMLGSLQNRYYVYADKISGPVVTFD